jgi:hypothetical protein
MFLDGIRSDRKTLTNLPVDALRIDATQAVMRPGGAIHPVSAEPGPAHGPQNR